MKRLKWLFNEIKWLVIGGLHVITGIYFLNDKEYGRHKLHTAEEGNAFIRNSIASGKPFAYCRYSYTEMDIMIRSNTQRMFGIPSTRRIKWLYIFCKPGESNFTGAVKYDTLMREAFGKADIIGIWPNLHMGDALIDIQDTKDDVFVSDARGVEPFLHNEPWSMSLEGKKVLVVSPFSEAIKEQYKRRELLWEDKRVLPEFELDTEDSIWFYKGKRDERFSDWFEAFDYLYERIMTHDFDIAILGCGYFGFALAAKIREAGRQAVHMGGATQLLFGIRGKRWDTNKNINRFYNEYWIRPEESLKPADDKNLDNGCYW